MGIEKKLHRCLCMMRTLESGKDIKVAVKAKEFGVSQRTILRDLNDLDMAGLAIINFSGREFSTWKKFT